MIVRYLLPALPLVLLATGSRVRAQAAPPAAQPAPPVEIVPMNQGIPVGYEPTPVHVMPLREAVPNRVRRPAAVYGEVLGKGLLYSVGFDYSVSSYLALGGSFSYFEPATIVSPYLSVYPVGGTRSALFLQLGPQLVSVNREHDELLGELLWDGVEGLDLGGQVSLGYEYRSGFLFRVAFVGLFNRQGFMPWLGLTFGGAI